MINPTTRAAFADELEKIASINWAPAKQVLKEGLIGSSSQGRVLRGLGITATGLQLHHGIKSSLAKEDPTGHGYSRPERLMGFSGEFLGGVLGSGLAQRALSSAKAPGWVNFLGSSAAGVAGALGARRAATMPFVVKRKLFNRPTPKSMQPMSEEDGAWRNQAPGVGNGASAHSPDAVEGQAQLL
jgi:hypothetical protein